MKRRKNAVYTGQSKRVSTGTGDRVLVDAFYVRLNEFLLPEDEIEIIPPEQVNPRLRRGKQCFIVSDYCVRKILPELTSLFRWGDEVTAELHALAPIVDRETAKAATRAADRAIDAAETVFDAFTASGDFNALSGHALRAVYHASYVPGYALRAVNDVARARDAALFVHAALVACIEAGDEATYNRIIALTNEMLESL